VNNTHGSTQVWDTRIHNARHPQCHQINNNINHHRLEQGTQHQQFEGNGTFNSHIIMSPVLIMVLQKNKKGGWERHVPRSGTPHSITFIGELHQFQHRDIHVPCRIQIGRQCSCNNREKQNTGLPPMVIENSTPSARSDHAVQPTRPSRENMPVHVAGNRRRNATKKRATQHRISGAGKQLL